MIRTMKRGQQGFISIFTVLIIMTVLTLITVGFSNTIRNAQRRTLDNQLNTQAFYAAESGINDARLALKQDSTINKTTCQGDGYTGYNNGIDAGLNVGYTCLLINSQPPSIKFDSIPTQSGNAKVVPFEASTGAPITSFRVTWNGVKTSPNVIDAPGVYPNIMPPTTTWGSHLGMLRIDLAPTENYDRANMIQNGFTFFLYPAIDGFAAVPAVSNGTAGQGRLLFVQCGPQGPCSANIALTSVSGALSSKYMLRMSALYNSVSATIDNLNAGGAANFVGAQAIVDVTGKANDVFRRLQVRLPLSQRGLAPIFAIQSGDSICKRILASPSGSDVDRAGVLTGPPNDQTGACAIDN